jgi:CRISPR-associated exonuclease Cas4
MSPALPDGLNAAQSAALAAGAATLDELTTATIHGFCQNIIHSYAVEADIDPGARILDASQAEAAFDAVFEQWLRRRLTGPARTGDPIATLSRDDPRHVVPTLHTLACFRRDHRSAGPLPADLSGRPDIDIVDAVGTFSRWMARSPGEAKTARLSANSNGWPTSTLAPSTSGRTLPSFGNSRIRRSWSACAATRSI